MAESPNAGRPLSPHLQIYRRTLTMVLSIVHRVTGVALYAGVLLLVWWLVAHASAILRKLGKRIDRALTVFGHESRPHALPPLDPERDDRSLD